MMESKVLLPFTKDDVKYLSDSQREEATMILLRELFPWDNKELEKWVSSRRKRSFYRYFDSLPHPERFSKVPQKMSQRLKRFYLSVSLPDEEEGVFTKHHLSLSDDMKIAEDLFNLGFHGLLSYDKNQEDSLTPMGLPLGVVGGLKSICRPAGGCFS